MKGESHIFGYVRDVHTALVTEYLARERGFTPKAISSKVLLQCGVWLSYLCEKLARIRMDLHECQELGTSMSLKASCSSTCWWIRAMLGMNMLRNESLEDLISSLQWACRFDCWSLRLWLDESCTLKAYCSKSTSIRNNNIQLCIIKLSFGPVVLWCLSRRDMWFGRGPWLWYASAWVWISEFGRHIC